MTKAHEFCQAQLLCWDFQRLFSISAILDLEQDEVIEVVAITDRWIPVWSAVLKREFPPVATFDDLDVEDRSRELIDAWVGAP